MSEQTQETPPETPLTPDEPDEPGTTQLLPDEPTSPDEADTEPTSPDEPDERVATPDEQPQGLTEKEIEQAHKKLAKLRETTAGRVSDIMGEAALGLIPCPACSDVAPGFVWHPDAGPVSDEAATGMRQLLGIGTPQQLKRHSAFQTCDACDGEGFIDTGSRREGYESAVCPGCSGKGYLSHGELPVTPQANGSIEHEPIPTGPTVYGTELPPEAQALRDQGWVVSPPITLPTTTG